MIYVIVGPTGIGKTKLSIALAEHFNTEIISGDSVQVYKELSIGSAKISEKEMKGIPHHLIDILEPTEDFSVALFQKLVRGKIKELEDNHKIPLIVGGTGLYIKSVLYNYNFEDTKRDNTLELKYQELSNEEVHKILEEKDFKASKNIHPNNRKRVLQAISRSDSNKVSENTSKDEKMYDFKIIGLTLERELLYQRINKRVDKMIKKGLIKEVKTLYDKGINGNSVSAIGYKELYSYFDKKVTLDEAIDKIKQKSRNLAKKQFTFFNNQFDINWLEVDLFDFDNTIKEAVKILEE
ncbi:tRNA dimethylallyltransferase [Candidatus Izimaplasma bacterium HR1]|jgi:tRNA dimethylallyltransferase|uniref:tRNA (adenosine(37)-N6)-dimethylallyltransferase MiaA n=1 Tax=Candidatus Izimoplasma sp. HR1 TaxID=1541959 RepID=UPI0004F6D319|nr:tRNA dimethylallyltransferase [Candidatus Izimaplasma bacterium HR1]